MTKMSCLCSGFKSRHHHYESQISSFTSLTVFFHCIILNRRIFGYTFDYVTFICLLQISKWNDFEGYKSVKQRKIIFGCKTGEFLKLAFFYAFCMSIIIHRFIIVSLYCALLLYIMFHLQVLFRATIVSHKHSWSLTDTLTFCATLNK